LIRRCLYDAHIYVCGVKGELTEARHRKDPEAGPNDGFIVSEWPVRKADARLEVVLIELAEPIA